MISNEKKIFVSVPCSCLPLLLYNCEVLNISVNDYLSDIVVDGITYDYDNLLSCDSLGEHYGKR